MHILARTTHNNVTFQFKATDTPFECNGAGFEGMYFFTVHEYESVKTLRNLDFVLNFYRNLVQNVSAF